VDIRLSLIYEVLYAESSNSSSDAFAGGFCAGVVQEKPLDLSIDMGQWLASLSIQELGPS
jgi:adenosine kinase